MIYTHRQFVRAQRQLDRLHTIKRYNFPPEKVLAKYGVVALDESITKLESELDRRRNWLNGTMPIVYEERNRKRYAERMKSKELENIVVENPERLCCDSSETSASAASCESSP